MPKTAEMEKISNSFGVYVKLTYDQNHHSVYKKSIGRPIEKLYLYLHKVDYKGRGPTWVVRKQSVEEKNVSVCLYV